MSAYILPQCKKDCQFCRFKLVCCVFQTRYPQQEKEMERQLYKGVRPNDLISVFSKGVKQNGSN